MPRLLYPVVALTLLAGAGCSDDGDPGAAVTTTTTTEDTTTSTAPTSSTTTATTVAPPGAPPELIQTGDDLVAIVQSLHDYQQWLSTNPDPSLLEQIAPPDSDAHESLLATVEELLSAGYRWDRPQEVLSDFLLEPQSFPGIATVNALSTAVPEAQLVDQEGNVVRTLLDPPAPARLLLSISLGNDGLWRFSSIRLGGA